MEIQLKSLHSEQTTPFKGPHSLLIPPHSLLTPAHSLGSFGASTAGSVSAAISRSRPINLTRTLSLLCLSRGLRLQMPSGMEWQGSIPILHPFGAQGGSATLRMQKHPGGVVLFVSEGCGERSLTSAHLVCALSGFISDRFCSNGINSKVFLQVISCFCLVFRFSHTPNFALF